LIAKFTLIFFVCGGGALYYTEKSSVLILIFDKNRLGRFWVIFVKNSSGYQGDQIGRIFADWAIVCFEQFIGNYIIIPTFVGSSCLHLRSIISFGKTFWVIFSLTHLGYDHNFLRFLPIFGEKIGVCLKNQRYDQMFA
jgi:hypothetical protein